MLPRDIYPTPKFLSKLEASRVLLVSEQTVRRRIRAGQIRSVKFGRRVLVPYAEIERLAAVS